MSSVTNTGYHFLLFGSRLVAVSSILHSCVAPYIYLMQVQAVKFYLLPFTLPRGLPFVPAFRLLGY